MKWTECGSKSPSSWRPAKNTTVIRYEFRGPAESCTLELRPLIAFRDYHATTHENAALDGTLHTDNGWLRMTPYRACLALSRT